jgi:hypothetical protein
MNVKRRDVVNNIDGIFVETASVVVIYRDLAGIMQDGIERVIIKIFTFRVNTFIDITFNI